MRPNEKIHTIYVETTSKCNLSCTYCHRTFSEYSSKNKTMSYSVFTKIVDRIDPSSHLFIENSRPSLFMHGYGEPTLNKSLPDMVTYAAESGKFSELKIVSNLTAVPASRYRTLFKCGLDTVYVSLDSMDATYVEKSRVGTDLDLLINNICEVAQYAKNQLAVITVLGEDNIHHLEDLYKFLAPLNLKQWNIQLMNGFQDQFKVSHLLVEEARRVLPIQSEMQINLEGFPYPRCSQPFDTLVVNVKGSVSACCTFFADDLVTFGNILESPLEDVFLSDDFKMFRQQFVSERPPLCEQCPYY